MYVQLYAASAESKTRSKRRKPHRERVGVMGNGRVSGEHRADEGLAGGACAGCALIGRHRYTLMTCQGTWRPGSLETERVHRAAAAWIGMRCYQAKLGFCCARWTLVP